MPPSTSILRVVFLTLFLAVMLSALVQASEKLVREGAQSQIEGQLIEREQQRWAAIKRGDSDGFAAFLAPEFLFVSGMGTFAKPETVKMMAGLSFSEHLLADFKVVVINPNTIILTYRASGMASFGGREPYAFNERHGSVWASREGEWFCVYHHYSPISKR